MLKKMLKNKKQIISMIAAALLVLLAVGIVVTVMVLGNKDRKISEKLELAERYMDAADHERAMAEYNAVLEIDPKNADAYLGLALVYEATGREDKAIEILEKGYRETEAQVLRKELRILEDKDEEIRAEAAATPTPVRPQGAEELPVPTEAEEEKPVYLEAYQSVLDHPALYEPTFDLAYIDDDEIPELVEMSPRIGKEDYGQFESYHMYTIRDGKALEVSQGIEYRGYFEKKDFIRAGREEVNLVASYKRIFGERRGLCWTECEREAEPEPEAEQEDTEAAEEEAAEAVEEVLPPEQVYELEDGSGWRKISKAEFDAELSKCGRFIPRRELSKEEVARKLRDLENGIESVITAEEQFLFTVEVTAEDDHVNFRTGPGTTNDIIQPIYNGELLSVIEDRGTWLQIRYKGQTGWVATSQVTILR